MPNQLRQYFPQWHAEHAEAGMKFIGAGLVGAGALAANIAPVPFLGPAAALVATIVKVVENVKANKFAMGQLSGRCEELLHALDSSSTGQSPEKLREMYESSIKLLDDIRWRMMDWSSHRTIKQFFLQNAIAEDIKRSHRRIDAFIEKFHIQSHIAVHEWMAVHEKHRRQDHVEMVNHLADIKNQAALIEQSVALACAESRGFMSMMHELMHCFTLGDHRHSGLSNNLAAVRRASRDKVFSSLELEMTYGDIAKKPSSPITIGTHFVFDGPVAESPIALYHLY